MWDATNRYQLPKLRHQLSNRSWLDFGVLLQRGYEPGGSGGIKNIARKMGYHSTYPEIEGLELSSKYNSIVNTNGQIDNEFLSFAKIYNKEDLEAIEFIIRENEEYMEIKPEYHQPNIIDNFESLEERIISSYMNRNTSKNYVRLDINADDYPEFYYSLLSNGLTLADISQLNNKIRMVWRNDLAKERLLELFPNLD